MRESGLVMRLSEEEEKFKSMGRRLSPDISRLQVGDPYFPTPEHICDAAREAMRQGYTHYVPGMGDKDLIEAICEDLNHEYGCSFNPEGVIITNGAQEGIYFVCSTFLSPGDEIILFNPTYSYGANIRMVDAIPVKVPLSEDFRLDRDAVKKAITPKTRAILFCNPNNPTGVSFTREDVEFLAKLALEHNLLLVSDEVYRKYYYDGTQHFSTSSILEAKDRTILLDSFSKSYAMAGWRIGYVATTPELAKPMFLVHRATLSCINWPTQRAALAALKGPQDCVREMVSEFDRRRENIIKKLEEVEGFDCVIPNSAFYIFGRFDAEMKSADMVDYLLGKKVAVRSGTEFGSGGEGWIRLSYSGPLKDVNEGIDRLALALNGLK